MVNGLKVSTYVLLGLTLLYALVGAIVVIWGTGLSFEVYGDLLTKFMIAVGILSVGQGVAQTKYGSQEPPPPGE